MSTFEELHALMREAKEKERKEFDKIVWRKQRRTRDTIKDEKLEKLTNMEVEVSLPKVTSKEEIYNQMKDKFRMAWKSPGLVNKEFSQVPTLRGMILNEWEIERMNLAERSYKAPRNFKGFKIPTKIEEFPRPTTPKGYKEHLDDFRVKYDDYVQRPTKYGKVHEDELLEKVIMNNKEPFRMVNTVQYRDFGFDPHRTWEAELARKGLKTK